MVREIKITPVLNGFVCKVGCQTVVFQSITEMVKNLEEYYKNPAVVEKQFIAEAVNKMNEGPLAVCNESCDNVRETNPTSILRERI